MKLIFGLKVMAIGLLIVFTGLILLIAIVTAISKILEKASKKEAAPAPAPAPVVEEPVVEEEEEDPYIPFVIAAAIAACEDNTKKFVVRSVRRVGNGWAANARREQMNNY